MLDRVQNAPLCEPILEPGLPIVDAHHHLWLLGEASLARMETQDSIVTHKLRNTYRHHSRYLLDEFMADTKGGHNVRASVYVEAHAMYRTGGPEELRSVGEIEFANGVAAMAASGAFGETKVCAGIVGAVDLRLGDKVEDVLKAHLNCGGGRYRGVRSAAIVGYDEDSRILGNGVGVPHLLGESSFREGFKWLHRLGLVFDVWLLEPQLRELVELARAFPDTQIILEHVGAPVGVGRYEGRREERFPLWRKCIEELAGCGNVAVKLGGLGIPFGGFPSYASSPPASSEDLAADWRPYIHTCIEAFGPHRCMFESNFPVDSGACSYSVLWNAFKRLTADASQDEKAALFSGTAMRIYGLDL